jgi:hypothetical protein
LPDFENNTEESKESNFQQPSTSKQPFKPARTAFKDLKKNLNPEIAKQCYTTDGKTLWSGKMTFAEPIMA